MARLNEAQSAQNEAQDVVKHLYQRQNREIAKSNSMLSQRIRCLERDNKELLTENIALREQTIRLQAQLDERDKSRQFLEALEGTRKRFRSTVEELNNFVGFKLEELSGLVEELNAASCRAGQTSRRGTPNYKYRRHLRESYVSGQLPEGYLSAIDEEFRSRQSSVHRKGALLLDDDDNDAELPPPSPEPWAAPSDSDEEDAPMRLVNSRPRRRESTLAQDISKGEDLGASELRKPTKRKLFDQTQSPITFASPELDFKFSKVAEKAAQTAKRQTEKEQLPTGEDVPTIPANNRRLELRSDQVTSPADQVFKLPKGFANKPNAVVRKALEPKSVNSDPTGSPAKLAIKTKVVIKDRPEKPERPNATTTKVPRTGTVRDRDTPPPESDLSPTSANRTVRRARTAVNYAEPSLRAKMRRDEARLVDAVSGEGKSRRRKSGVSEEKVNGVSSRAATPEPTPVKVKKEELEDDTAWMDLPAKYPGPIKELRRVSTESRSLDRDDDQRQQDVDVMMEEGGEVGAMPEATARRKRPSTFAMSLDRGGVNDKVNFYKNAVFGATLPEDPAAKQRVNNSSPERDPVPPQRSKASGGKGLLRSKSTSLVAGADRKATVRRKSMQL